MKMSDLIADFIGEMLSDGGGVAEVQRKSLADRFSCVPSQINYVIETRFTPEHGYLVESQRGGGGYIRIVRLMDDKQRTLLEAARGIGGRLTQNDAARLTRALLSAEGLSAEVVLDSHANMAQYAAPESVDCIVFNFGRLPGGDPKIFTTAASSLPAIDAGLGLLRSGGVMVLALYYGKENGYDEKNAILERLKSLNDRAFTVLACDWLNRKHDPPLPIFIWKD